MAGKRWIPPCGSSWVEDHHPYTFHQIPISGKVSHSSISVCTIPVMGSRLVTLTPNVETLKTNCLSSITLRFPTAMARHTQHYNFPTTTFFVWAQSYTPTSEGALSSGESSHAGYTQCFRYESVLLNQILCLMLAQISKQPSTFCPKTWRQRKIMSAKTTKVGQSF